MSFLFYLLSLDGSLVIGLPQEELLQLTLRQRHHHCRGQHGRECARGGGGHQARGDGGGDEGEDDDGLHHVEDGCQPPQLRVPIFHFSPITKGTFYLKLRGIRIFGEQMS